MTSSFANHNCPDCGKLLEYWVDWDGYYCTCGQKWEMKADGTLGNVNPLYKKDEA